MFAEIEARFHAWRRRFDRSEWAIRHLKLPVSEGTAEEPGLLLIQIDGLSREEMERAMQEGRMPFLRRLHEQNRYGLTTFYPGLPTTTPAVQAEIFYGLKCGVPSFSFLDRATGEVGTMFDSERVKAFEKLFASQAEGLLAGGSSWSNIYRGGAADEESHFCIANLGFGRGGHLGARVIFALMQLPALIRIFGLVLLELAIGLWDLVWGIFQGQKIVLEVGMVLSRMCVGIGMRELLRVGGKLDLARGLPIVHVNFLGYDEMSHRRGPGSGFAHWCLAGIDSAIRDLYRNALRSPRRDYQVWIFSDHGQEHTRSFETEFRGGTKEVVKSCLFPEIPADIHAPQPGLARPFSRKWYEREKRRLAGRQKQGEPFELAGMGPVGHLYFATPLDEDGKRTAARRLAVKAKIPAVLHLTADGSVTWHDAHGSLDVAEAVESRLGKYPAAMRSAIAEDLAGLCRNENAGDLVMLGYNGEGDCWTFVAERGSHAGLGPREVAGFLLTPPGTRLPEGSGDFVRPGGLRAAALHLLGRQPMDTPRVVAPHRTRLRVMTYNVHSCLGTDGRVSPRRIARVIAQQNPDIVALQEVDHGKARSRSEDQATIIADLLGYHVVFCPTVIVGEERYGHAVLSRLPIETMKVAELPVNDRGVWPERRAALWSRILLHDTEINVVTTHFGLSASERLAQMKALLGPDWVGPVLDNEPVIVCGDFNCRPGGPTYRRATAKLRDMAGARGVNTFSSLHPFTRLDYIFASGHFTPENVTVVRTELTRISSDHLPVVADLMVEERVALERDERMAAPAGR